MTTAAATMNDSPALVGLALVASDNQSDGHSYARCSHIQSSPGLDQHQPKSRHRNSPAANITVQATTADTASTTQRM